MREITFHNNWDENTAEIIEHTKCECPPLQCRPTCPGRCWEFTCLHTQGAWTDYVICDVGRDRVCLLRLRARHLARGCSSETRRRTALLPGSPPWTPWQVLPQVWTIKRYLYSLLCICLSYFTDLGRCTCQSNFCKANICASPALFHWEVGWDTI
jgi:hypothetical protein